jgi:hypothetical protein
MRRNGWRRVSPDAVLESFQPENPGVVAPPEGLDELAALDDRKSRVVEPRSFGGFTVAEAGSAPWTAPRGGYHAFIFLATAIDAWTARGTQTAAGLTKGKSSALCAAAGRSDAARGLDPRRAGTVVGDLNKQRPRLRR